MNAPLVDMHTPRSSLFLLAALFPVLLSGRVPTEKGGYAASVDPPPRIEWIDVHVHLVGRSGRDYEEAARAALKVMDEEGLQKIVLLPPPGVYGNRPPADYEGFLAAVRERPRRFASGGDQFIASPGIRGEGPGITFSRRAAITRERTRKFLEALPPDLARKIAYENSIMLYGFKD